jgi:predicted negative regulator of RcsB-dependent stress response
MTAEGKKSEAVTAAGHIVGTKSATAQRRHSLQQNTLAETLQKFKQVFSDGLSRTTWMVLGIVAVAVLLYFVWRFFARSADEKNSELSVKLQLLMEGESPSPKGDKDKGPVPFDAEKEYDEFAKANAGTVQGRIARFQLARLRLTQGQRDLGNVLGRDKALDAIDRAAKAYEELQGDSSDVPLLHQEALLRAGQARECLGEFDKALANYEKLTAIKEYKDSVFTKMAADAAKRLKDPDTRRELEELKATFSKKGGS